MTRGLAAVGLLAALLGAALVVYGPVTQPQTYHEFADARACLGVPNCSNVLSSLVFVGVAIPGLLAAYAGPARIAWQWVFVGAALTGAGSAWYHLDPRDATLLWDRLGMAMAFGAYLAALLLECAGARRERAWLGAGLAAALAAVAVWYATGDLRAWVLVQTLAVLATPAVLLFARPRPEHTTLLWAACLAYGLAKAAELADGALYAATGEMLSGHALKHLLAAAGVLCLALRLRARRRA